MTSLWKKLLTETHLLQLLVAWHIVNYFHFFYMSRYTPWLKFVSLEPTTSAAKLQVSITIYVSIFKYSKPSFFFWKPKKPVKLKDLASFNSVVSFQYVRFKLILFMKKVYLLHHKGYYLFFFSPFSTFS